MTLKTKKVKIEWDTPKGDDGNPYDQLVGYEVTHNVPGFDSPLKVSSDTTSSKIMELPEGIYNVGIASIDYRNQKSKKAVHNFEITNTILNPEVQRNFGIPIGGVISTECFINPTTGIFKTLDATGWSFASSGVPQVYRSFQNGHANRYTQDCSDIKSENFSTMTDFEAEIKSHYLIFDASDSNDPLKLVKWEDLVYSTNNDLNLGYWYDTVDGDDGTSSDLPELTFVAKTGAVTIADESNEVVGVGTSFTTEYAIDDIIYFSDTKAAKIVNIASDTSLTINKTFSTATSVAGTGTDKIKKQGFMPDKNYDAVLYAIRNDQGTFKKFQMVNLTVDPDVFSRSRVATLQAAPQLLNFNGSSTLTTSYTNLVLTANGNGFLSPKFKITGTGFNNSEISQSAHSSFQNPTSGKTFVYTLDKVDAFVSTDLDFTVTIAEAADETNTDLQSEASVTIPFIKDGDASSAQAKKSLSGLLYYVANSGLSSSAPSAPSGTATYTFSTGAFSNLDNAWSFSPPTYAAGNSNKYWYQYFKVEETSVNGNTGSVVLIGDVTQGFGFSGVVTFTGSGQLTDGSSTSGFGTSNFDGAYNTLTGKPNLFDGAYGSLSGAPTIPTAVSQLSNDSNFLGSGANISVLNNDTGFVVPTGVAQAINNNTTTIDGGKITTNTVNANRLQSNSVLSNVIYVGNALITNTSGKIYSAGKTDYANTTGGFFLGYSSGYYKFDIGNSSEYLRWTGSGLEVKGDMTILNPGDIAISTINNDSGLTDDTTATAAQSTATTANNNAVSALSIANSKTTAADAAAAANLATKAAGKVGGWTITGSYIQGGTNVYIASGKTTYGSGTGFWLGNDGTTPKFDIGSSTGYLRWDGSALNIKGNITLDNASSINISGFNNNSNFTDDTAADAAQVTANGKTTLAAANAAVNANVTSISGGVITTGTINASKIVQYTAIGSTNDKFGIASAAEISGFSCVIGALSATSSRFAGLYFGQGSTAALGAQNAGTAEAGLFSNSSTIGSTGSITQGLIASSTKAGNFIHTSTNNYAQLGTPSYSIYYNGTIGPFTGSHDALLADSETCAVGDILVDTGVAYAKTVSDVITNVTRSTSTSQKSVIGVYVTEAASDHVPSALAKTVITGLTRAEEIDSNHNSIVANKTIVIMNSVGEGQVNVCGENGNIEIGDLIVSSSTAGKGMKQDDDIVRSCTVGKAREAVTFASASTVKQIACIYMCG